MATQERTAKKSSDIDLKGKSVAFFGEFNFWPSYHPARPEAMAAQHGARVVREVDPSLDYLVLGGKRGSGKSEAKKSAEKLMAENEKRKKKGLSEIHYPVILDEAAFRELFRLDLTGKSFAFIGGFDCCGGELDEGLLTGMVTAVGGTVTQDLNEQLNYVVIGMRRGVGKTAAVNRAQKLKADGAKFEMIDEERFMELMRTDSPATQSNESGVMDFAGFFSKLHGTVDQGKLGRAMKMLKSESFKLYSHNSDERLVGVVRSQRDPDKVYSSWLTNEGKYGCNGQNLDDCMGLQGSACKHLLVLLVGLTHAGALQPERAYNWIKLAQGKGPRKDNDLATTTFIEYKAAQLGEIDWRPTETLPEDFYAF
jgi:hypothetical protein